MKKLLGIVILGLLLSGNAYAAKKDLYLECEEIVQDVRKGGINAILYEKGKVLGTNYVFLKKNLTIKIYFRYDSESKPFDFFSDTTKAKITNLGFSASEKGDYKDFKFSDDFKFIKIDDQYILSKKTYAWNIKTKDFPEADETDYDSSGRCKQISKQEYKKAIK
tara:strand:- start:126 stop:617 length:492 start_codon:yes stop_codon:yes gene_type:complete